MKIRPVGEELFHAKRRTDTTTFRVDFRNFAKAPKMHGMDNCKRTLTNRYLFAIQIINIKIDIQHYAL